MKCSAKSEGFAPLALLLLVAVIIFAAVVLSSRNTTHEEPFVSPRATNENTETKNNAEMWKTHEVKGLLTFQYPGDWAFSENCNDQIALYHCIWTPGFLPYTLQTSIDKTEDGAYMGIRVNHKQTPESQDMSILEYDSACAGKEPWFKGTCIKQTILGKPALRMQTKTNHVVTSEVVHIILDSNDDLTFEFKNSEKEAGTQRAIFEKILSSIQLIKKY